jgi:hypothetical protein
MTLARSKAMILSLDADVITEWVKLKAQEPGGGAELWRIHDAIDDATGHITVISIGEMSIADDMARQSFDESEDVDLKHLIYCVKRASRLVAGSDWSETYDDIAREVEREALEMYRAKHPAPKWED